MHDKCVFFNYFGQLGLCPWEDLQSSYLGLNIIFMFTSVNMSKVLQYPSPASFSRRI